MKAQRQKGVSLLEILLVVMVAAGIVSAAIYYYSQTLSASRVAQAANLIQQINKAGYECLQIPNSAGEYPADFGYFAQAPDGNALNYLKPMALIPCENNSCFTNPWGGVNVVTSDGTNTQYMLIKLAGLPAKDCARLQEQMKNIAPQNVPLQNSCSGTNGTVNYQVYL